MDSRERWRRHDLDGALLWFQPSTGIHVRLDGPETRAIRRTCPRAVMFGITNACNLACSFCSRDLDAASGWTVDNAFAMLSGLAAEGLLEVAFGGGEPLAFPGLAELVARLGTETTLAVHLTTNGTLVRREEKAGRLDGLCRYGQVRVSVYDDNPWEDAIGLLARRGARVGANVIVCADSIRRLEPCIHRLAALGCDDVALLRYVGDDPRRHLDVRAEDALREIVARSPVRTRVSVCFGDRLPGLPRLFEVDDCGAGRDFVVLTSDRTLMPCSFHHDAVVVDDASDVLRAYRSPRRRGATHAPARRTGCARPRMADEASHARSNDGVHIWQSYSANNSGESVLVGRFERAPDAARFLADLLPDFVPQAAVPSAWKRLLEAEHIPVAKGALMPDVMSVTGKNVLIRTECDAGDAFPELRAYLWRKSGLPVFSTVHEHDTIRLLAGFEVPGDGSTLAAALPEVSFERRGLQRFAWFESRGLRGEPLAHDTLVQKGETIARELGGRFAAELVATTEEWRLVTALSAKTATRWGGKTSSDWLAVRFWEPVVAEQFAAELEGEVTVAEGLVILRGERVRPRLGLRGQQLGGHARFFRAERLRFDISLWGEWVESIAPGDVSGALRSVLAPGDTCAFGHTSETDRATIAGHVVSATPKPIVEALLAFVRGTGARLFVDPGPEDPTADAIARISLDVQAHSASSGSSATSSKKARAR